MSFPFVPFQFNLSRNNSQQSFPPSYIFDSLNFFLATQSPSIKIIPRNNLSNNTNSSYLSLSRSLLHRPKATPEIKGKNSLASYSAEEKRQQTYCRGHQFAPCQFLSFEQRVFHPFPILRKRETEREKYNT